jgi:S1-C subfamily serine protease
VVLSIEPSGPAFRTDLRPADVIQKLEGAPIRSALDLQRELFARKVGQPVQLSVWRPSGSKVVVVQTMEVPEKEAFRAMVEIPTATKMVANERFGLSLKEVKSRGVRVEVVEADSCAARAELVAGDLITDVEGHPVRSVSECLGAIRVALSKGAAGGAILQIERQGRRTFVVLKAL